MNQTRRLSTKLIARTIPGECDLWLSDNNGNRGLGRLLLKIAPRRARRFYLMCVVTGKNCTISIGLNTRSCASNGLPGHARVGSCKDAATVERQSDRVVPAESPPPVPASDGTLLALCLAYVD